MSARTVILPDDIKEGDEVRVEFNIPEKYLPNAIEYEATADRHARGYERPCSYFLLDRPVPPAVLPTEPGTVIAIGDWWLVKLRGYDAGAEGGWEFLPVPRTVKPSLRRSGREDQCVYSNEWAQSEADQEGGFTVISSPALTRLRPEAEVVAEVLAAVVSVSVIEGDTRGDPTLTIKAGVFKRLAERWES